MPQHAVSLVVVGLLILFGLYRRVQRTIGFQPLNSRRMIPRAIILGVVGVLVIAAEVQHPVTYLYDAAGLACGGILTYYAVRTTSFERRGDVWYYRPHPWIGAILLVLFIGRIGFRLYTDYMLMGTMNRTNAEANSQSFTAYAHDPFTTAVLFAIVSYYIAYTTWIIRSHRNGRMTDTDDERERS